ncbi:MAG: alkaline phosphatase D family protein [Chloroflexota bacterium]|nr:alkaline phosphatase D family protein [Chloroflexota bacterium]
MPVMRPIEEWPLLLCGPMVRRVEPRSVSIFVALKHDRTVKLSIYLYNPDPNAPREFEMGTAQRRTVPLGKYLHVAVVTFKKELPEDPFKPGQVYAYDLDFIKPAGVTDDGPDGASLDSLGLLQDPYVLGYVNGQLPSFSLAPGLKELHLLHASCRKPHAPGRDALRVIDKVIAEARAASSVGDFALQRPHQLFLTGDQIYADDVALSLLASLSLTGQSLLEWSPDKVEKLPVAAPPIAGPEQAQERDINDPVVAPGKRQLLLPDQAGFFSSGYAGGHLMFLAEYYAMYLFAWSDELWPRSGGKIELAEKTTVLSPGLWPHTPGWPDPSSPEYAESLTLVNRYQEQFKKESEHFEEHRLSATVFANDLPRVRRVFANVPTYMMFDDHEVTDDWFLHRESHDDVRKSALGRRILRNALTAYAIFQAWGNTPDTFESGNGASFLTAVQSWQTGAFDPQNKLDALLSAGPTPAPLADRLLWDYQVTAKEHQVIVLDTRTWRDYPPNIGNFSQKRPPALIAMSASNDVLKRQLDDRKPSSLQQPMLTFVVSPAPVLGFPFIELKVQPAGAALGQQETLDYEAWVANHVAFEELLRRLASFGVVVILSGDVHYGYTNHTAYFDHRNGSTSTISARFVQLCSSALKNQAGLSLVPQFIDYDSDNLTEDWFGYHSVKPISYDTSHGIIPLLPWKRWLDTSRLERAPYVIPSTGWGTRVKSPPDPDWRYRIHYVKDQSEAPEIVATVRKHLNEQGIEKVQKQALRYGLASLVAEWRSMVGFNNVGQLKFTWDDDLNKAVSVRHTLWWYPTFDQKTTDEPIPLTRQSAPITAPLPSEMPTWKP